MARVNIWVDDVRPAPDGYIWCKSTNEALRTIIKYRTEIDEIALDHDAGDYRDDGGDYIAILKELERLSKRPNGTFWRIRLREIRFSIHSMNPVGAENMRSIIFHNGWNEIKN